MHIDIHTHGFTLTPGLREHVRKRLAYALSHAGNSITRLTVRLSDVNGPKGGDDKRCLIEARLKQVPAVVIEDVEADLYVAIDRAAEKGARNSVVMLDGLAVVVDVRERTIVTALDTGGGGQRVFTNVDSVVVG